MAAPSPATASSSFVLLLAICSVRCQNIEIVKIPGSDDSTELSCRLTIPGQIDRCVWTGPQGVVEHQEDCAVSVNKTQGWDDWTCRATVKGKDVALSGRTIPLAEMPDLQALTLNEIMYMEEQEFGKEVDYRLPRTFEATSYDILVTPQAAGPDSFTGETTAHLVAKEAGSSVTLHTKRMTFDLASLSASINGLNVVVKEVAFDFVRTFVTFHLDGSFEADDAVDVSMTYEGTLGESSGLYKTYEYEDDSYFYMTQGQPTNARAVFPCLDEPEFKASFNVRIGREEDFSSLANAARTKEGEEGVVSGFLVDTYAATPVMSTYLVSVVVSKYAGRRSDPSRYGERFTVWSPPQDQNKTLYAATMAPIIYDNFVDRFGKFDIVAHENLIAVPRHWAGAMENWGSMTFMRPTLLSNWPQGDPMYYVPTTIAHELAHIWFGDLVTMRHWDNAYLNEAFAGHFGNYGGHLAEPDMFIDLVEVFGYWSFRAGDGPYGHPIFRPAESEIQIAKMFDQTTYTKGAAIVRMMRLAMGDETFFAAIRAHVDANKFGSVTEADFLSAFDGRFAMPAAPVAGPPATARPQHNASFADVMKTWTHQADYPSVRVTRGFGAQADRVTIEQVQEDNSTGAWWIPITYAYVGGDFSASPARFWLDPSDAGRRVTFQLDPDPSAPSDAAVIFNVDAAGYYRTLYDEAALSAIVDAAARHPDSISELTWLQFQADLAGRERAPYEEAALARVEDEVEVGGRWGQLARGRSLGTVLESIG